MFERTKTVRGNISEELYYHFNRLNKLTKSSAPSSVAYAIAMIVILQDEITDAKFESMRIKLAEFYAKQDKLLKELKESE